MSAPEASSLPGFLEHPTEVLSYFRGTGIEEVICQEKHMGSRAVVIVCKTPDVAKKRFGLPYKSNGMVYSRTGQRFFKETDIENSFLLKMQQAISEASFWDEFKTDWFCLDGEIMPWSFKAEELIKNRFASTYAAANMGLKASVKALEAGLNNGTVRPELLELYMQKLSAVDEFGAAYRPFIQQTDGITGIRFAPFQMLAAENAVFTAYNHNWHLETLSRLIPFSGGLVVATKSLTVKLADERQYEMAEGFWLGLTENGGEGMVVKPLYPIAKNDHGLILPGIKCRGRRYLHLIFGPEYLMGSNLSELKKRSTKRKNKLALNEFALGYEALNRFVNHEQDERVQECILGILALENENVDSTL